MKGQQNIPESLLNTICSAPKPQSLVKNVEHLAA